MKVLLIDTSTKNFSIAIADQGTIISSKIQEVPKKLNQTIVESIDAELKSNNLSLNDIEVIVIGRGPGSFTSLRVGMATVKGLAFANKIPLIGVGSLHAIALNVEGNCENLYVTVDAKRKLVYGALLSKVGNTLRLQTDYQLLSIEEALTQAPAGTTFVGDGATLYKEAIEEAGHQIIDDQTAYAPRAEHYLGLVKPRLEAKDYDDLDDLEPLYLYPEDCQVRQ